MKCKYGSDNDIVYFNVESRKTVKFRCENESLSNIESCKFHDSNYYTSNPEEFKKDFSVLIKEADDKGKPLMCIGFYFPVDFKFPEIKSIVYLNHSKFKRIDFGEISFKNHIFFDNCEFEGDALFPSAKFDGVASFKKTQFKNKVNFIEACFNNADFSNATFSRASYFSNSKFYQISIFSKTTFEEIALFSDVIFEGSTNFSDANFHDDVLFKDCQFLEDANFYNCTFLHIVRFSNATFSREVNYSHAQFHEEASFSVANFKGPAKFSNTKFFGLTNLSAVFFDVVEFFGTNFSGDTTLIHAEFYDEVNFIFATFEGRAYFSNVTFFGDVKFNKVRFLNLVDFTEVMFAGPTDFSNATFADLCYFVDCDFEGFAKLNNILIEKPEKVHLITDDLTNVSLLNTDVTRIFFSENAIFHSMGGNKYKTIDERNLEQNLSEHENDKKNTNDSKRRTELKINLESVIALYRNLRENYEYRLRYDEAGQFFIRKMELKRLYSKRNGNLYRRGRLSRILSFTGIYFHLSRYGENYKIPFVSICLIILGSSFYWFLFQLYHFDNGEKIFMECFDGIALCSFERSLADITGFANKSVVADYVTRILSIFVLGVLFLSLRRKFERRFRH